VHDITPGTHKSVAKYIAKGTDPAFVDHFHLRRVQSARSGLGPARLDKPRRRPSRT